ncbi:hypothetical protein ACEPAG_2841 [Sanghuangporus baumii]
MSGPRETVDYDIPSYVTDFSAYFDHSDFRPERQAAGGFADVFSNILGTQKYAVKVLRPWSRTGGEATMKKDFNFELSSWVKLGEHANILKFVGICYTTLLSEVPQPCFLSFWQENGQLDNYLKNNPNVDLLEIIRGVFAGVKHMYGKGVVHGDIRGGNILVSSSGIPQFADYGLSKLIGRESSISIGAGTTRWMARELLHADPSSLGTGISCRRSKASDIWALGMTILELLSGRKPYDDYANEYHIPQVIIRGEKPKFPGVFHESCASYEDILLEICKSCWVDNPSERPTIERLCDDLQDLHDFGIIQLLEGIETLSLSGRNGTFENSGSCRSQPNDRDADRAAEQGTANHPPSNYQIADPDYGFEETQNRLSDGYKIPYMTAFSNHLVASKRLRKHVLNCHHEGPPHAPRWYVSISEVESFLYGEAFGPSKKLAQEEAAKIAFGAIENEEIGPEVPYLPIFLNRLNARGSQCHAQFRWKSERFIGKQCGEWISTLYWKGIAVGRGRGRSERLAQGEAARAAPLNQILLS